MRTRTISRTALGGVVVAVALVAALGLSACAGGPTNSGSSAEGSNGGINTATDTETSAYHKITAADAKALMDEGGVTVVDVRTQQEYADGHVPGAVNIPNEDITTTPPDGLNKDDTLIVYCRTGVRSKQASDKLVSMGFTNVNDMGGIVDWTYDTVKGTTPNGD